MIVLKFIDCFVYIFSRQCPLRGIQAQEINHHRSQRHGEHGHDDEMKERVGKLLLDKYGHRQADCHHQCASKKDIKYIPCPSEHRDIPLQQIEAKEKGNDCGHYLRNHHQIRRQIVSQDEPHERKFAEKQDADAQLEYLESLGCLNGRSHCL